MNDWACSPASPTSQYSGRSLKKVSTLWTNLSQNAQENGMGREKERKRDPYALFLNIFLCF